MNQQYNGKKGNEKRSYVNIGCTPIHSIGDIIPSDVRKMDGSVNTGNESNQGGDFYEKPIFKTLVKAPYQKNTDNNIQKLHTPVLNKYRILICTFGTSKNEYVQGR